MRKLIGILLASIGAVMLLITAMVATGYGAGWYNYKCPSNPNFGCPAFGYCYQVGHCSIGAPHQYTTTIQLRSCDSQKCSTCDEALQGCWYRYYALDDTDCDGAYALKHDVDCWKICHN